MDSQHEIASSSETDASSERYVCLKINVEPITRARIEEAVHMAVSIVLAGILLRRE